MPTKPNVVWITLDSVRADHTSPERYKRDTTPGLQQLANSSDGQYHQQCIAHGRWSLPSISSILTGRHPIGHQAGLENKILTDETPTVAELFANAGYRTAALSRNPHLSAETNLDRGFEKFEYIQASDLLASAGLRTTIKFLANIRKHSAGFKTDKYAHSTPFIVNDVAKRRVREFEKSEDPFFFYLHYNEPHTPYYPPLSYIDEYTNELDIGAEEAAERVLDIYHNKREHMANYLENISESDWEAIHAMYDAEIRYTDECITRLIHYIQGRNLGPTIIIVTADHGDLFGEYDLIGHESVLHDGLIRVPLFLHGIQIDSDIVQHIDIIRALAEMGGVETDSLQGIDPRSNDREFAIAQCSGTNFSEEQEFNPDYQNPHVVTSSHDAIRASEYKLLTYDSDLALFDLPDEYTDISGKHPETAEDLEDKHREWVESMDQDIRNSDAEYSEELKESLRALGYKE